MQPRYDLIRALAQKLFHVREFGREVPDEDTARELFFAAAYPTGRCPDCGAEGLLHASGRVRCRDCRLRCSLTAKSPLRNTKLPVRLWLAAIWHLHVAPRSIPSRVFAHQYRLRVMTAWELLSEVRDAFPRLEPVRRGRRRQVLGRQSLRNRQVVSVASDHGGITALPSEEAPRCSPIQEHRADVLHLGHLHAWTVSEFRGVRREHQWRYLAEWADRQKRRYVGMPAFSRSVAT